MIAGAAYESAFLVTENAVLLEDDKKYIECGTPGDALAPSKNIKLPAPICFPSKHMTLKLRNLILRYTQPGDLVLDQMAGSGTTLMECKLLERRVVGVDINPDAFMVARNRLDFSYAPLDGEYKVPEILCACIEKN